MNIEVKMLIAYLVIVLVALVFCTIKYPKSKNCAVLFSLLAPGFGQLYFKAKYNWLFFIVIIMLNRVASIVSPKEVIAGQIIVCFFSALLMIVRINYFDVKKLLTLRATEENV